MGMCCLRVSSDIAVDMRVRVGLTLTMEYISRCTDCACTCENRGCVCVYMGECLCMHVHYLHVHVSTFAAWCATSVYVSCWVYTVVSGYLCVGYMLNVYVSMHNDVPVCMCTVSVGTYLYSGSFRVLYVCEPWCGFCPDVCAYITVWARAPASQPSPSFSQKKRVCWPHQLSGPVLGVSMCYPEGSTGTC